MNEPWSCYGLRATSILVLVLPAVAGVTVERAFEKPSVGRWIPADFTMLQAWAVNSLRGSSRGHAVRMDEIDGQARAEESTYPEGVFRTAPHCLRAVSMAWKCTSQCSETGGLVWYRR